MEIKLKLDNFEGPMDLLLHLIGKDELKIYDINISKLIDDYIVVIKEAKNDNLYIKVEFLKMASELLEIKSLSILNKKEKKEKEDDLEQKILEYKMFKDVSLKLKKLENEFNISHNRKVEQEIIKNLDNEIIAETEEMDMSKLTLSRIFNEYKNIFKKKEESILEEKMEINLEPTFSLEDGMKELESILIDKGKIYFAKLFKNDFSRIKIVSYFLAILELYKLNIIDIIEEDQILIQYKRVNI